MAKIDRVQEVSTDLLKPYERNAKIHSEDQVDAIKRSIREFGFISPCLIDKDYNIIAGHGRIMAAKQLGLHKVPCVFIEGLTEEQKKAYILADNRLTEMGRWDFGMVSEELEDISIDMSAFGFDLKQENEWFSRENRWDDSREEGNDEYNEFLDKFEQPKTTDDCYTPDEIYEAVVSYVEERYKEKRQNFIRPFYPGGDYKKEEYAKNCIVVDNPPFSILAEIIQFYCERSIRFFLFCPGLVGLSQSQVNNACTIMVGCRITYENGAIVPTNFVTNMEENLVAFTDPSLRNTIDEISDRLRKEQTRELPKYEYPYEVLTCARMNYLSKWGQEFSISKNECQRISKLDAQGTQGIFGGGLLISERKAKEHKDLIDKAEEKKEQANQERIEALQKEGNAVSKDGAIFWGLSDREKEIVKGLK